MADNPLSRISSAVGRAGEALTSNATTGVTNLLRRANVDAAEQSASARATNALVNKLDDNVKRAVGAAYGIAGEAIYVGVKSVLANPLVQAVLVGGFIFLIVTVADVINNPVEFFLNHKDAIDGLTSATSQSLDYYVSNHAIANNGDSIGLTSSTPSINWTEVCDYLGASETINDRAKQIALATQDADDPPFQICLAAKVAAQILSKN